MSGQLLSGFFNGLSPERRLYLRQRLNRLLHPAWLGTLRRTTPLSQNWGFDRGWPVDRYYIDRFLAEHRRDIHGRVLEVRESGYTKQYGIGVERADVLDVDRTNPLATIVVDLARAEAVECADCFDCFVLTQTLQFIYDIRSAIAGAHHLLRPGGTLLATMPAVSRINPRHEPVNDYWRLTVPSASALFGDVFDGGDVQVHSYGNVLAAIAFLAGMAADELSPEELDVNDADMPVLIAVRAVKRQSAPHHPR
jgi:SAM-dependent methyltransferase